jgi:NAD(P)-dependent dehydrogenase (short-subunit alcohol dehydrogenase family)
VTVHAVTPRHVATDLLGTVPAEVHDVITANIPARRLGRPGAVARVDQVLVADAAGQVEGVIGGLDM